MLHVSNAAFITIYKTISLPSQKPTTQNKRLTFSLKKLGIHLLSLESNNNKNNINVHLSVVHVWLCRQGFGRFGQMRMGVLALGLLRSVYHVSIIVIILFLGGGEDAQYQERSTSTSQLHTPLSISHHSLLDNPQIRREVDGWGWRLRRRRSLGKLLFGLQACWRCFVNSSLPTPFMFGEQGGRTRGREEGKTHHKSPSNMTTSPQTPRLGNFFQVERGEDTPAHWFELSVYDLV
jgi:hypothetical protein